MSGEREVERASKRYGPTNLGRFAFTRLLLGVGLLMIWPFVFGAIVEETTATRHAARGEGIPGTFTAESQSCGRGGCTWYGTFTTGDFFEFSLGRVALRGDGGRSIHVGEAIPALDVGSGEFVHMKGGSPEWGEAIAAGFIGAITGGLGIWLNGMVLWGVYWTRASPASRKRAAREHGESSALRRLADRDRWVWSARPGSSAMRMKIARSGERTLAGVTGLLTLVALLLLFGLFWAEFNKQTTVAELVAASWAPLFAIAVAGVVVQTFRLVLARPRMWVTDDELVIWDALLLWKVLRIPRTEIAAIHYGDEPRRGRDEEHVTRLTPFREELNLVLRMRDEISLPSRRLRWGNWFWVMLTMRNMNPQTSMPQRGYLVRWLCLRVKDPRRVAADLDRWLAEGRTAQPPEAAPIGHAHDGTVRTHRGVGGARIKIKGRLPRPVLAEFGNEGSGTLRAWLRRTEFGRGTPVVECGPGAPSATTAPPAMTVPPATTVLDDRLVSGKALTKRFLHVESEGRWTVTISGPERARGFTRSTTGSGPEVLNYQGPAGIAVVTCPDGQAIQVYLRGPDLAVLHGCDPVVSTAAMPSPSPGDEPVPSRSTFAVPAQAILQVKTAGAAEWRIDVTPLEQADDSTAPPTGHVRPFEHSLTGNQPAVVRYLGPPGPVLFRSGDAFGLLHLNADLTPVRTLALPDGDTKIHLHSHTLLQVTGGHGTWSLEEMHPAAGLTRRR
ncbi:hypothetical protein HUT06_01325 [Actinomadura sp. NAK00032]|uniref:hypothetical protein n=1 Tax=Actinomadura sp. NAK00032 TaxID=2742128 RepID=UPI0015901559|nr:hypothetical protein [Actinomadura sp. NAK00032]QKW32843.1 hypothetical protein HUT06_01325 [Actinomadura sp. NAK00032]